VIFNKDSDGTLNFSDAAVHDELSALDQLKKLSCVLTDKAIVIS